ncbi:M20 family metallopeptidase [Bacteroidota bacterium]
MNIKESIQKYKDTFRDEVIAIRRHLHMHPELSFNEENTSLYIRGLLDNWGIHYDYPFVEHGILAIIEGTDPKGPVIALRSDMDALPIVEMTDLDFSSKNKGVMHACGHDMHMASLLGTIRILNEMKNEIRGKVLFIFQPGEEKLPGGAKLMMEEGLFKKNKPDYIIAQHVLPEMEAGTIGFKSGEYMASSDEIYITVKGKGGHGALPEKIKNPILMSSHILIALHEQININNSNDIPTLLSFGKVLADGAVNVIPDEVRLEGTFRTMNEVWRKKVHQLIKEIAGGIAKKMGGTIDLEVRNGYPVLKNDPGLTQTSKEFAINLLGKDHVIDMDIRMTAEDFAWYSQAYPSMMYRLGVKSVNSKELFPLHTSRFIADEKALQTGMKTMAWLAISLTNSKNK